MNSYAIHSWWIIPILMLGSCGSSFDAFELYVQRVKNTPAQPAERLTPELKPITLFTFPEDDQRRSPFQRLRQNPSFDIKRDKQHPKQPLEQIPLDGLQFVGTIKTDNQWNALIRQPGGLVTLVGVGDSVGENHGQIISIDDHEIKIEESINRAGLWYKKMVTLDLRSSRLGEQHE